MKELSIEEKAKRFDEALTKAKESIAYIPNDVVSKYILNMFPELKESEGERIRKEIIDFATKANNGVTSILANNYNFNKWIAWIEKEAEQKTVVIIPKFRVGDVIRPKGSTAEYTIESISGECYHGKGWGLHINSDDDFELVERESVAMIQWNGENLREVVELTGLYKIGFAKWFHCNWDEFESYVHSHNNIFKLFNEDGSHYEVPVGAWIVRTPDGYNIASKAVFKPAPAEWSEEDENLLKLSLENLTELKDRFGEEYGKVGDCINWLKSLRPQNTWKPDSSMLICLEYAIKHINKDGDKRILSKLLEQLKKL